MKPKVILMAYQDDAWVKPISTLLCGMGYRVETSRTVDEIISKVRKEEIRVVLLDDEMGGIKASNLIPLLKRLNPRVQIIVISSGQSLGQAKRLREAGIFYQAMKPVDGEEIRSAVACAFDKIEREQPEGWVLPFLLPGGVAA